MDAIFHRRSIRRFTSEAVSEEDLDKIIRAGMAAPTACNDKPWEFYIITNQDMKELISDVDKYAGCAQLAPVDIVLCYRSQEGKAPEYAQINMAIVAENMMIEADSLGLGTVFLGCAPEEERMSYLKRLLNLPEGVEAFGIMPVGHPANQPKAVDKYDGSRIHRID